MRIGGVPYGVGARLLTGLDAEPGVVLRRDPPSALIEALRAGELDAALVSSIEAFRRPGYGAVSGIGIACAGPVHSVRAFRRPGPIRRAAVDAASESSVALLRILLERRLGAPGVEFERVPGTRTPDALPHDLVLLIGDDGLHADPGARAVIDLGAAWHEWTGLPFVFALWLIAPGADAPRAVELLAEAHGRGAREPVARGPAPGVYHELGALELRGLERFRREAISLGLCDPHFAPQWVASSGRALVRGSPGE